jgi:hypothetical protein
MQLNADKISDSISKINIETTEEAEFEYKSGTKINKLKPFTSAFIKFLSSLFKNENKYSFVNRVINSYLTSFSEFIKQLKLLKLNNKF